MVVLLHYNISHGYIYSTQALKGKTTTIWLLPVVYNKSHFIQQFCNNDHITSHACKNKLDASKLSLQILRGFGLPRKEPILLTDKNHNVGLLVVSFRPFPGPSVANAISLMLEKKTPPKPLYTVQAVCQA